MSAHCYFLANQQDEIIHDKNPKPYLNRRSIDIEAFAVTSSRWQIIQHFPDTQLKLTFRLNIDRSYRRNGLERVCELLLLLSQGV